MHAINPILSATTFMIIVVAAIALVIIANEAVVYFKARKKGDESGSKAKKQAKTKREPKAKKAKRSKAKSAPKIETVTAFEPEDNFEDPYAAFGPVNSAGVESFTPVTLQDEEAAEITESGPYKYVQEVESMRVQMVDRESVRSGRAISDVWEPQGELHGTGAVDYQHSSLASQLRAAQDSDNYDSVDEESMRIQFDRDPSVRIMDTRIDSAALRRSA